MFWKKNKKTGPGERRRRGFNRRPAGRSGRKNTEEIDKLLEEIEELPLDAKARERIDVVSDEVLEGEYQRAIDFIDIKP
jgi:hypothetical protein